VVLRALQKDPALRFQSAADFARALAECSRSLAPDSFQSLARPAPAPFAAHARPAPTAPGTTHAFGNQPPGVGLRWLAVTSAGLLALAAIAALGVVLWQRQRAPTGSPFRIEGGGVVVESGVGNPHAPVARRPRRTPPATVDLARYELDGQFDAALDLARTHFDDAELVIFSGSPLNSDGTANLTTSSSGMTWQFQSAKNTPRTSAGGMPALGDCMVVVSVIRGKLQASRPPIAPCMHTPVALPSCTVRQVVEKALLGRSPKKISIAYKAFGKQGRVWSVSIDGSGAIVPDDC
jgi:hypothetical protein